MSSLALAMIVRDEASLLPAFLDHHRPLVDEVVVVDCPEAEQVHRLTTRDGETAQQASRMLAAQVGRAARIAAADTVIDNSGDLRATRAQVQALHQRYLRQACAD